MPRRHAPAGASPLDLFSCEVRRPSFGLGRRVDQPAGVPIAGLPRSDARGPQVCHRGALGPRPPLRVPPVLRRRPTGSREPGTVAVLQAGERTDGLGVGCSQALASGRVAGPVDLTGVAPIARAISSAGGIAFDELDESFMLRRLPGVFAAGEMLDWEAPTGGYLLQASLATGAAAGRGALKWLNEAPTSS